MVNFRSSMVCDARNLEAKYLSRSILGRCTVAKLVTYATSETQEIRDTLASPFQSPTNADRCRERPRAPDIEKENNRRPDMKSASTIALLFSTLR